MAEPTLDGPAPRRSSRISSQPKADLPPALAKSATKKAAGAKATGAKGAGTKRAAEEQPEEGESETSKKVKLPAAEESAVEAVETAAAESSTELKPIDIGDAIPALVLKNEKGEDVDTSSLTTEKGVVLFLVPKADTPGCTNQACGFRDVWGEFMTHNFDVYCLSADTPAAQTKWQTKKQLPYQLLSDPTRTLIGALGAADGKKTKRSHFVFEKGGKLVDIKMPVKPVDSPRLALEFIKGMNQ
ncbi:hypothetical protein HYDPIDRAFT_183459 [Hydnomerulius pinastri MD-312]|uniref:thioredoxin-dependent peroxiredoxin n=1 Tax=Hydnomerulius pinastri MD-312 TaxID=994086 RepID=A0A0C9V5J7_9AGAM|nr:hypothetical protein HYDPIDRAFT_183459 [Hydnomerulius pinastri MD-312]